MTSFEVQTAAGAIIKTFDDRQAAINFARNAASIYPGLTVCKVTYVAPLRLRIWTENHQLVSRAQS
jgi:hypothetical protein